MIQKLCNKIALYLWINLTYLIRLFFSHKPTVRKSLSYLLREAMLRLMRLHQQANQVCLVMTADCLPVLFFNKEGTEVAAAHAGWRGLCDGILEETVAKFKCPTSDIIAWLGPAIGPTAFQVGEEIIEQFCAFDSNAKLAFTPDLTTSGKFLGNLYQLATQRLNKLGITEISGGGHCTYTEQDKFFSYRRDKKTGRMASLIWIE